MDWVKIESFDNLYNAEFYKSLLEEQGIKAIILNKKDSMYLIGEIELYVPADSEKKAINIIQQFYGLTKINSFILEKPILEHKKYIEEHTNINIIFKTREDPRYQFKNFELFVKNNDLKKVLPFLDPYKIENWNVVSICHHVRQTYLRVKLLDQHDISSMVIKHKDVNFKLQEIFLLVPSSKENKAKEILNKLPGWERIDTFDKRHIAEIREELLSNKGISSIIKQVGGHFELYVPAKDKEQALKLITAHKRWLKINTYESLIDAQADQIFLLDNGIDASIVSLKDDMFLIGGYDLYVDEDNLEKAVILLNQKHQEDNF